MAVAVRRRAWDELGLSLQPEFLYKFEYRAAYGERGSEFELCWVFLARERNAAPRINTTEISAWRWIAPDALDREIEETPRAFTPWLQLEWQRLRRDYGERLTT